jgi:hypothetical protein
MAGISIRVSPKAAGLMMRTFNLYPFVSKYALNQWIFPHNSIRKDYETSGDESI